MADSDVIGEPAEEVDLSDLTMVILNVETREGRQLSMVWEAEGGRLSLEDQSTIDVTEDEGIWSFRVVKRVPAGDSTP